MKSPDRVIPPWVRQGRLFSLAVVTALLTFVLSILIDVGIASLASLASSGSVVDEAGLALRALRHTLRLADGIDMTRYDLFARVYVALSAPLVVLAAAVAVGLATHILGMADTIQALRNPKSPVNLSATLEDIKDILARAARVEAIAIIPQLGLNASCWQGRRDPVVTIDLGPMQQPERRTLVRGILAHELAHAGARDVADLLLLEVLRMARLLVMALGVAALGVVFASLLASAVGPDLLARARQVSELIRPALLSGVASPLRVMSVAFVIAIVFWNLLRLAERHVGSQVEMEADHDALIFTEDLRGALCWLERVPMETTRLARGRLSVGQRIALLDRPELAWRLSWPVPALLGWVMMHYDAARDSGALSQPLRDQMVAASGLLHVLSVASVWTLIASRRRLAPPALSRRDELTRALGGYGLGVLVSLAVSLMAGAALTGQLPLSRAASTELLEVMWRRGPVLIAPVLCGEFVAAIVWKCWRTQQGAGQDPSPSFGGTSAVELVETLKREVRRRSVLLWATVFGILGVLGWFPLAVAMTAPAMLWIVWLWRMQPRREEFAPAAMGIFMLGFQLTWLSLAVCVAWVDLLLPMVP